MLYSLKSDAPLSTQRVQDHAKVRLALVFKIYIPLLIRS